MTGLVLDHLWQSTLFAAAAGLLALALRRNPARVRFWLWFAAAAKFLVPFALIAWSATQAAALLHAQVPAPPRLELARSVLEPATGPGPLRMLPPHALRLPDHGAFDPGPWTAAAWLLGSTAVLWRRSLQWRALGKALADASPIALPAALPAVAARARGGPAVIGFLRPVLVLPQGLAERLTPAELEAVLEHEAHHARRRDNLLALPLLLAQTLFWFHPVIWWIGRRLFAERERACDEAVLESGIDAETYARGLLEVCRQALEPAPVLAAAIGGADLKRRIRRIMADRPPRPLGAPGGLMLTAAATTVLAVPVLAGIYSAAPAVTARMLATLARPVAVAVAPKPAPSPRVAAQPPAPARSRAPDPAGPTPVSAPAALVQAIAYSAPAEAPIHLARRFAAPAFQPEPPAPSALQIRDAVPPSTGGDTLRALADRTAYVSGADFGGMRFDLRGSGACPDAGVLEAERRLGGQAISTAFDGRVRRFVDDALAGKVGPHDLSPAMARAVDRALPALQPALATRFGGPGEARLIGEDTGGRDVYLVRPGNAGYVLVMVDDLGRIEAALFCAAG